MCLMFVPKKRHRQEELELKTGKNGSTKRTGLGVGKAAASGG